MIIKPEFWAWLEHRAKALQALAAITTVFVAVTALVGVKVQIDASARQQREQSARDIYREYLSLSIAQPKFSTPDYCAIAGTADGAAYDAYVQYLLYTSEQVVAVFPDWDETMLSHMEPHKEVICGENDWSNDTVAVQALVSQFRAKKCVSFKSACPK